ncbi:MAG: phosphate acetyltransferase [Clostridia bacterium]|nr:phosphate acetyltransferase [Clostridia bacterium]
MNFIEKIKEKASKDIKIIVLPEATDIRVLKATEIVNKEKFAKVVLIGNEEEVKKLSKENNINLGDTKIINPEKSEKKEEYANTLCELRKAKGMTKEEAEQLILNPVYYGMMMVKLEEADGLVSGAAHSTADTLRPALQIIKTAPGTKLVSTFAAIDVPNCEFGENGLFFFGDCGLNQNPNSEELAQIALSTAQSFENLVGADAKVAMLSYSTMGSAKAEEVTKVQEATKIAKENAPELMLDGEMQLDAAIVPEIAKSKAPRSNVAGHANVLIFPELEAGNIGYKLVERLAKAEAYGPICQGIAKPVNDLSRGCKAEDIAGVVAITAVQAQMAK